MKKKTKVPPNWEDRPDSFERFEKLTRGLMAVPKKELDAQKAKYERKKATKKRQAA
ncbi:MAG: hypothetical protein WAM70_14290 [Pyrinomonadaceae bacterium]